ncbi:MAG: ABC transporter permease subunit [Planctomycetota bacterium]|nr:ABC transporter permease subunit [Planctomycetota bacterium]
MAMHDLGYRSWDADAPHQRYSWLTISRYGARLAWKSQWLKRIIYLAFMPFFGLLASVFIYEQVSNWPQLYPALFAIVETLEESQKDPIEQSQQGPGPGQVLMEEDIPTARFDPSSIPNSEEYVQNYVNEHRSTVWRIGFYTFFRRSQGILMVLLVGMIAPGLISRDMQSRAFLLYFSRPITPFQYLLGKATTVWIFLLAVTTLPALVVYLVGILFSPGLGVILNTWDIPLRILLATAVLTIPTTMLALCLSSLVNESRYARFAWFAIWIVGFLSASILFTADLQATGNYDIWTSRWAFLSPYHVLGIVERWAFGLMERPADVIPSLAILGVVTVVCFGTLMRRITAPIRV